jgi:Glycosyl transferase family 2
MTAENGPSIGADSVFVIPVGPFCRTEYVGDTIESIRHFAPDARVILVDDSRRGLGAELAERYQLTVRPARVPGVFGGLYLNLSEGFREALTQPFRILVRLDTDALIAGSDFESKAIALFDSDPRLGSLGSFHIAYSGVGVRNVRWAKRRIIAYFAFRAWSDPRSARTVLSLIRRARKQGYKLGESIMGGAAVYRYEAVDALRKANLLGRTELAGIGLHEDHVFGLCLFATGFTLGEFGNRLDDLPMGVKWKGLPAAPKELLALGKSIIHSTKGFEGTDESEIRRQFQMARQSK